MKEDILEQLANDYLQINGYFTIGNVKFRPLKTDEGYESRFDSVHSDIDLIGFNPLLTGADRVVAVSCKSWQEGFAPEWEIKQIEKDNIVGGRKAWCRHRELCKAKWAAAFRRTVEEKTGSNQFIYITAVTRIIGERQVWENYPPFLTTLGSRIKIVTLLEMVDAVTAKMTTTVANSELGRTLQLLKAAGYLPNIKKNDLLTE